MLSMLNNIIKEYKPIIEIMWALFPFTVTVFMAYIAYQQWNITKRDSNIDLSKKSQENLYKPLKKIIGHIIFSIFESKEKKSDLKNKRKIYIRKIGKIFKQHPYLVNEYNSELIKYSFDLLCHLNNKQKHPLVIKKSWKIYKKAFQWLFKACIPDEIKINIYPNRFPNLYLLIKKIIIIIYKFLTPYFIQDKINSISITIGFYFWFWIITIHILLQTLLDKIKKSFNAIVKYIQEQEKNKKKDSNE